MRTTYSVICILHGNVEQVEVATEGMAYNRAQALIDCGARCVAIYDESDELVWESEPDAPNGWRMA